MTEKIMLPEVEVITTDAGLHYALFKTRDYISTSIRKYGHFEKKTQELARQFIKTGIVLDIGCNLGSFSIPLAKEYNNARFVGFEPQKVVYQQFNTNVFLNSLTNVECHNYGLSSKEETLLSGVPNYLTSANIGGLTLDALVEQHKSKTITGKFSKWDHLTYYDVKTLDHFSYNEVDLIKIDVEGMELEVLTGAVETLIRNDYPPIIFECWQDSWFEDKRTKLFKFLEEFGYTDITEYKNNYLAKK